MRNFKRFLSASLAVLLLTATSMTVSSCKKKESNQRKVLETDPWYTARRVELDPGFTSDKYSYVYPEGPWLLHDRYVMRYSVDERATEERKFTLNYNVMCIFDLEGKLLSTVNLSEIMAQYRSEYVPDDFLAFGEGKDSIRFYFETLVTEEEWNTENGDPNQGSTMVTRTKVFCCELDPDTGEELAPAYAMNIKPADSDSFWIRSVNVIEGYEVSNVISHEEDKDKNILVISKDGEALYDVDFDKAFGPGAFLAVRNTYGCGQGKAIVECVGKGQSQLIAEVDLASGQARGITDAKPLSPNQKFSSTDKGIGYLTKATGIYEYDVTGRNEMCILDFDNCDVNRFESQSATVLAVEDNKVVIGALPLFMGYEIPDPAVVYTLEKAATNPNAGKTILKVASLSDSVSYFEAEAMKTFNEQNPEYHVQLVLYDQNEHQTAGDLTGDIDTTDRQMYSALSMVSGSLAMDIRSGNGPDVILGAAQSIDVLDGQYLEDLTPYLEGKTYDASAYYSRIIEASKLGGKAYYIPTTFTIAGIVTDGSRFAPDQVGFTYEQYASTVANEFQGVDLVTGFISCMHFLNLCFERNYDQWVKDKKMNLDMEAFREMAAFFKERIPEGVSVPPEDQWDTKDPTMDEETIYEAVFIEDIRSLRELARINYFGKNLKILGLPSENGTGPSANITNSFSITAGSAVREGAYAFLDILLSESIQKTAEETFPINRAATSYRVERLRQVNQVSYDWFQEPGQLSSDAIYRCASVYVPDTKLEEILLQTFESVDTVLMPDNAVMMIVDEELPAYILGQKDLDTVIATINNRAQNVFNER